MVEGGGRGGEETRRGYVKGRQRRGVWGMRMRASNKVWSQVKTGEPMCTKHRLATIFLNKE